MRHFIQYLLKRDINLFEGCGKSNTLFGKFLQLHTDRLCMDCSTSSHTHRRHSSTHCQSCNQLWYTDHGNRLVVDYGKTFDTPHRCCTCLCCVRRSLLWHQGRWADLEHHNWEVFSTQTGTHIHIGLSWKKNKSIFFVVFDWAACNIGLCSLGH